MRIQKSNFLVAALTLAVVFLTAAPAHADYDSPAWIGAMGGLSVPSASQTSARGAYGLTAGAKLGSELGLGVYYLSSHNNESFGPFNYDLYGVEFGYHFEGQARGAYFGARVGTSKLKVDSVVTPHTEASTSPFHYGLFAGYNQMLGDHFSIGGEANFMSVSSSSDSGHSIDGFTVLNFLLTAKVWL